MQCEEADKHLHSTSVSEAMHVRVDHTCVLTVISQLFYLCCHMCCGHWGNEEVAGLKADLRCLRFIELCSRPY